MGGFSAVLGNPPFVVYKRLKSTIGTISREFIQNTLSDGEKGLVDLSVYFLLKFESIVDRNGNFSIVTTNSVKQGDNRSAGLLKFVTNGIVIYDAKTDVPWGHGAQVVVDCISFTTGKKYAFTLNGEKVEGINEFLSVPGQVVGTPNPIPENVEMSNVGSYLLGTGFILEKKEAEGIIESDAKYARVIKPYIGGKDINNTINQHGTRYAIDFEDMSIDEIQRFPIAYEIVRERVLPFRLRKNPDSSFILSAKLREKWWIYANPRRKMYDKINDFERVLAIAQVSKTMQVAFVSTNHVLDQKLIVFASDKYSDFAFLSSSFHIIWAMKYSSRMRNDLTYSPKQVFHTLPIPTASPQLDNLGMKLDLARSEYMIKHNIGLTELYSKIGDESDDCDEIQNIRDLHVKIDKEVLFCYNFDDVNLEHEFRMTSQGKRYIVSTKSEKQLLDKLLALNFKVTRTGGA